jgi:hypothetical protein
LIYVNDKKLCFTPAGRKAPRLVREAEFAHVCPQCGMVIHAMAVSTPGDDVPPELREKGGHALQIDLKLCGEANLEHRYIPEYDSSFIDLGDGQRAQYFVEAYHMRQFAMRSIGRCKYLRGVDCFSRTNAQQALRLMGILKLFYGAERPAWEKFQQRLDSNPTVADVVLGKLMPSCGVAADAAGKTPPVVLISKQDWSQVEFNLIVQAAIDLPAEGTANVEV